LCGHSAGSADRRVRLLTNTHHHQGSPMTDNDLAQLRRTVRVLELLDESFRAHQAGDLATFDIAAARANEVDAFAVSGITGGMVIGEIPHPEKAPQAWAEYVAAAQSRLAEAETAAGQDWDCTAYGPEARPSGALCFFAASYARTCPSLGACRTRMAAERQRVFDLIQEKGAAGDETMAYLAGEFTSPDQILNAEIPAEDTDD
jgi:hypothetical protein